MICPRCGAKMGIATVTIAMGKRYGALCYSCYAEIRSYYRKTIALFQLRTHPLTNKTLTT